MARRSISQLLLAPAVHSSKCRSRYLKPNRCLSSLTLPPSFAESHPPCSPPAASASASGAASYARQSRFDDLRAALDNNGSPSFVWANYTNLLTFLGHESIPLALHREVLRRCTPPALQIRAAAIRRLEAGNIPDVPHIHESRFQIVMRNIRSLGVQPSINDYHFILEQFAAVGHFVGSYQVYKELMRVGLLPDNKTVGFCLQSIAHRFTLPIKPSERPALISETRQIFKVYMDDMRTYRISFTAVNLDLTLRILKETLDRSGFESLMRWGYGIDLSNPDRVALEYSDPSVTTLNGKPHVPFPFTTAALNTTIDLLGRLGDVSKLVQAFEVLTQPLHQADQHFFHSFEEDGDDFGVRVDVCTFRFPPPYAFPNTATYNMLLQHISRAGHAVFARHYLLQAIRLDRTTDRELRHAVWKALPKNQPLNQIAAPHFAINRRALLSVMGEANVDKNIGLMKWLSSQMPYILRKKQADLAYFSSVRREERKMLQRTRPSNQSKTSPSTLPPFTSEATMTPRRQPVPEPGIFELDLENSTPPKPSPMKYFDLNLHIEILRRNVSEMEDFATRLEFVLGRTTQRLKERIGRRVWTGKDVYLLTENRRVPMTKAGWNDSVNYQPRRDSYRHPRSQKPRIWDARQTHYQRPFSTMASSHPTLKPIVLPLPGQPHLEMPFLLRIVRRTRDEFK